MHVFFLVGGQNMYVNTLLHCHFCIQMITHPSLPAEQGLMPHTKNKCTLIITYLMPLEVFYQTQIIILSCMYFGCFHGNQHCVASYHYFYTWGVLQEVDIISTVRPYRTGVFYQRYKCIEIYGNVGLCSY